MVSISRLRFTPGEEDEGINILVNFKKNHLNQSIFFKLSFFQEKTKIAKSTGKLLFCCAKNSVLNSTLETSIRVQVSCKYLYLGSYIMLVSVFRFKYHVSICI